MAISEEEMRKLLVDIFDLTGERVGLDDPVTVAALFHSERFKAVTREYEERIEVLFQSFENRVDTALAQGVESLGRAASEERRQTNAQYRQMIEHARQAANGEVPAIKRELEKFARSVFRGPDGIRKVHGYTGLTGLGLLGSALVIGAAGFFAGALWIGPISKLSPADAKNLEMGRAIANVIPTLDPPTKERLERFVEENSKRAH